VVTLITCTICLVEKAHKAARFLRSDIPNVLFILRDCVLGMYDTISSIHFAAPRVHARDWNTDRHGWRLKLSAYVVNQIGKVSFVLFYHVG